MKPLIGCLIVAAIAVVLVAVNCGALAGLAAEPDLALANAEAAFAP